MNTGYNNFNSATLTGLVDINADSIITSSLTATDINLENSLSLQVLNFSDNINGVDQVSFQDILIISDNIANIATNTTNIATNTTNIETNTYNINDLLNRTYDITFDGTTTAISHITQCEEILNTGLLRQENDFVFSSNFINYNTGIDILQTEFQTLHGITTTSSILDEDGNPIKLTIQDQLNSKESNSSSIDANRIYNGSVDNTTFNYISELTSDCQAQLDNKEDKTSTNINVSRLANGTVNDTKFQYINSLTSNCQNQITERAGLSFPNNFTASINTFKEVDISNGELLFLKSNASMYIVGSTTDTSSSILIESGNLNLTKGFIKGRADGFNYANDSYDTYTGYCYNLVSTAVSTVDNVTTSLNGIRTLPQGVYMISGVIIVSKGTATYTANTAFDINWIATGGIVPSTINRQIIATTVIVCF
jgi:hypothetical protein